MTFPFNASLAVHGAILALYAAVWYPSVRALIKGFEKNAVAGLNYRLLATLSRIAVITGATVLPYGGLLRRSRAVRARSGISVALSTHNFLRTNAAAGRNA